MPTRRTKRYSNDFILFAYKLQNSSFIPQETSYRSSLQETSEKKVVSRFRQRLDRLRTSYGIEIKDSLEPCACVRNLSSMSLDEAELKVLNRGLNFAATPNEIPTSEIVASVEAAINGKKEEEKAFVRKKCRTLVYCQERTSAKIQYLPRGT